MLEPRIGIEFNSENGKRGIVGGSVGPEMLSTSHSYGDHAAGNCNQGCSSLAMMALECARIAQVQRIVTSDLDLAVAGSADLIFGIATHTSVPVTNENIEFVDDNGAVPWHEIIDAEGNRLHRLTAGPGSLRVRYRAVVTGRAPEAPASELDLITYTRPSRYAESDSLFSQARWQFGNLSGVEQVQAVRDYVAASLAYAPDATMGTDSAVTTLASGRGVCRDFAHVVIGILRALDVPARYVACYAPGLRPMDFHAVAEAHINGAWHVLDATGLSDRTSLVRIATGRDAADCAFLTFQGAHLDLEKLAVDAWVETNQGRVDPLTDAVPDAALVRMT